MQQEVNHSKIVMKLLGVVVGMFAFGFALVPLYEIYCDITGANGKTSSRYESAETQVIDESRIVKVQFITNNNGDMPWEFRPSVRTMKVHPGELNVTNFYARNTAGKTLVAQAVPSVAPFHAAEYLHKTECFCFEQQQLADGEDLDMPLRFIIDRDLPKEVTTLTLSYTLFDITENYTGELAGN